jgi:hypothetical protein
MKILTVRPPVLPVTISDVLANTLSLAPRKGFWDDFKGDFFNHVPEINKNLSSLGLPNLGKGSV